MRVFEGFGALIMLNSAAYDICDLAIAFTWRLRFIEVMKKDSGILGTTIGARIERCTIANLSRLDSNSFRNAKCKRGIFP